MLDESSIPQTTAVASELLACAAISPPLTIAAGVLALASARLRRLLQKQR